MTTRLEKVRHLVVLFALVAAVGRTVLSAVVRVLGILSEGDGGYGVVVVALLRTIINHG